MPGCFQVKKGSLKLRIVTSCEESPINSPSLKRVRTRFVASLLTSIKVRSIEMKIGKGVLL